MSTINSLTVDAHVRPSGQTKPIIDVNQNWEKLFMKQKNGFLTVIFTRKIKVCGQTNSGEINLEVTGTQPVIFAWAEVFKKKKSSPTYHGGSNRGSQVLAIFGRSMYGLIWIMTFWNMLTSPLMYAHHNMYLVYHKSGGLSL